MRTTEAAHIRRVWLLRAWLAASLWAWSSAALGAAVAVAYGCITVHNVANALALIVLGGAASAGLLALGITSAVACRWRRIIAALQTLAHTGQGRVAIGRFNDLRPVALALCNAAKRRARVYDAALTQDVLRRHLTAELVHDIATPVSCFGALLEQWQNDAPELFVSLDPLQCHIETTLHDLARLGRSEQPKLQLRPTWFELGGLVEGLSRAVARTQAPGRVVLQIQPTRARVDPHRVRSAALALLDNALRHGDGGRVFVEVQTCGSDAVLTVCNGLPSERATGVPAAQSPYSAGLGVPWARAIAEAHGGGLSLLQSGCGRMKARLAVPLQGPHRPRPLFGPSKNGVGLLSPRGGV